MVHHKLPKGSKQVSKWQEVSAEKRETGYAFDEITVVTYEADIEYPNGNSTAIVMVAQLMEVYYKGKREYRQTFYGEASESDARRETEDAIVKLFTRIDKRQV